MSDRPASDARAAGPSCGPERRSAPAQERARLTVRKRIKAALGKIRAGLPALGHHLESCVKTGSACVYTPPPGV